MSEQYRKGKQMIQKTAMAAAFERRGISARDAELHVAIAKFQNTGGTYERLMEMAQTAYGLPVAASLPLSGDHAVIASDRQPNGDAGHARFADEANRLMPASPLTNSLAAKVLAAIPRHTRAKRGLIAISGANKALEKSIMQSFKIADGRGIGEVRRGEANRLIGDSRHQTFVLVLSQQYVDQFNPTADMLATFADLIPVPDMERIVQNAARLCDEQENRANAA